MLLVKTKIGPSKIHGIGIFADQVIRKNTVIWKFQKGFDLKIHKSKLKVLSVPAKKRFLQHSYFDARTKTYILDFDDIRFINHSENPNIADSGGDSDAIALRTIKKGEELTINYRSFDAEYHFKMMMK